MRPVDLASKVSFSSDRFLPQLVYGSDRVRVFLLSLEPGQGLPPRPDSEEMVCLLLEGRARLTIGNRECAISAGQMAAAGPGEVRAIRAEERVVALWIHVSARSGSDAAA
jgi:quercetin dioxygenase-like cupin family protein